MKKLLLSLLVFLFTTAPAMAETAYERVMHTGEIRCSYGLWDPAVMRDPNTGEFSGYIYEIMQEVGKALNIKVSYVSEVDWGQIPQSLVSQKADAHCAGVWATPARGKHLAFTYPISFYPAVAFARSDDNRFDNNLQAINDPSITVSIIDDDVSEHIQKADFQKAKTVSKPQLAATAETILMVAEGKADVTFEGPIRFHEFEKNNPGTIKIIPNDKPVRLYANTIGLDNLLCKRGLNRLRRSYIFPS